jgi:hypothetical protein
MTTSERKTKAEQRFGIGIRSKYSWTPKTTPVLSDTGCGKDLSDKGLGVVQYATQVGSAIEAFGIQFIDVFRSTGARGEPAVGRDDF